MRRLSTVGMDLRLLTLVILATAVLSLPGSIFAAGTGNKVLWDTGQPISQKAGQVTGSGTYEVGSGWSAKNGFADSGSHGRWGANYRGWSSAR
jgi:hypothetical protein